MTAAVLDGTLAVEITNVADVAPADTVTLAGTVALFTLELNVTTSPLGPAAALSVTVPVAWLPPKTEVGLIEMPDTVASVIVKDAVF